MNHYIDIQILPSHEFSDYILMDVVFTHLHKALVSCGHGEIGISFPKVNKTLGNILRLHGHQFSLHRLMSLPWVGGLLDYVKVSNISLIPEKVLYRVVKRVQTKSSSERLFRRSIRKGWLTEEEAKSKPSNNKLLPYPYVNVKSQSTGQPFRLFIQHGPLLTEPVEGKYSAYGLNSQATIPWF